MSPALRAPSRPHLGRPLFAVLAVVLALSAGLVGTAPAGAASARGGPITRSEVIWRAQYWVDHQPGPYDQGGYSPGPGGDHHYRRDCSGYVSMAWHLDGLATAVAEMKRLMLQARPR